MSKSPDTWKFNRSSLARWFLRMFMYHGLVESLKWVAKEAVICFQRFLSQPQATWAIPTCLQGELQLFLRYLSPVVLIHCLSHFPMLMVPLLSPCTWPTHTCYQGSRLHLISPFCSHYNCVFVVFKFHVKCDCLLWTKPMVHKKYVPFKLIKKEKITF